MTTTAPAGATPAPHPPLTVDRLHNLHAVAEAARCGRKVRRQDDEGRTIDAVARGLVTSAERRTRPGVRDDVRDCLLRVTVVGGLGHDRFWPVDTLAEELYENFVIVSP